MRSTLAQQRLDLDPDEEDLLRHRLLPALIAVTAGAAVLSVSAATLVTTTAAAAPVRQPTLTGRAVLPALTFGPGGPSGSAISPANGVTPPFSGQPVQGFSALIESGRPGGYLALSDNGYGSKANSADFLLRAHRIRPDLTTGNVALEGFLSFSDPRGLAGQALTRADRLLTGADFDPESIRRTADGTYWVGEEFGPSLLHFSAAGELMQAPVRFTLPDGFGPGLVRSPDAPEIVAGTAPAASANLPRSRGIEGMALSTDSRTLYPSLEGALTADTDQRRRFVYAFDVATGTFRSQTASFRLSAPGNAIGDLTAAGRDSLLVIDRDNAQGTAARTKQIAVVDIGRFTGDLAVRPLVDLLDLANPGLVGGPSDPASVGLGDPFGFPFQTIESVLVKDPRTLLVADDNNFPFSSGRRPGVPDDNEIIEIRLPAPLPVGQ